MQRNRQFTRLSTFFFKHFDNFTISTLLVPITRTFNFISFISYFIDAGNF